MNPSVSQRFRARRALILGSALTAAVALMGVSAGAQGRGPGGDHGGGDRGGFSIGLGRNPMPNTARIPAPSSRGESSAGLQLGPPGRWWDNKTLAHSVGLNTLQQQRMDDVFSANRDNLMTLYKNLQHEESQLKKMTRSQTLDENKIFQQIDRVTMARGDLSKAYAHMELQIRKEMTPEQTAKLDEMNGQPAQ